jgi:hypothetical protein
LGGIISISGFVPLLQEYPKFFRKANRGTEILAINGFEDSFVRQVDFALSAAIRQFVDFVYLKLFCKSRLYLCVLHAHSVPGSL